MVEWSDRHECTSANVDKYVPEESGVYRLIYQLGFKEVQTFYIGQSENLKMRLHKHLDSNEPNQCIKNHLMGVRCFFRFALVPVCQRDYVEAKEIGFYKPRCNEMIVLE